MTPSKKWAFLALILLLAACFFAERQTQIAARRQALNSEFLLAVRVNDMPAAAHLLDVGANPNARGDDPLPLTRQLSLALRYPQARRWLFDPRSRPARFRPDALWEARVFHHRDMAALLLKHGANPNIPLYGIPPLVDIVAQADTPMLKTFLDGGANVNLCDAQKGMTPLMSAAIRGQAKSVQMLLDAGADVKLKNKAGKTALELARENKHEEIVERLTAAGATP